MTYKEYIDAHTDEFLKDLNTLVSIESIRDLSTADTNKPFGNNCRKVLDAMISIAKRDGFKTKDIDGYAGVVEYGTQEETFGVLGHLDVVPLGEGWTKAPLQVTENDGYIFGRGVLDDKGPALAAYYAIKMIRDLQIPLKKRIMLITGCDEESGMDCIKYYKKHAEIPHMGFVPDADFPVIYGEKGQLRVDFNSDQVTVIQSMKAGTRTNVVIGKADCIVKEMSLKQEELFQFYCLSNHIHGSIQRNENNVQLHIDGVASHGAFPYNGINAAMHMLNFIGTAYNDTMANDAYQLLHDWKGTGMDLEIEGVYMGFLTMNVGIVNVENGHTLIQIDIRYPNDTDAKKVMDKINQACASTCFKAECISDSAPLFVDPQSELVQTLLKIYAKYTGDTFSCPIAIGGGTYARQFENFVSYGPERPTKAKDTNQFVGGCHQPDEGIDLHDLLEAIAIYADAIVTLCN